MNAAALAYDTWHNRACQWLLTYFSPRRANHMRHVRKVLRMSATLRDARASEAACRKRGQYSFCQIRSTQSRPKPFMLAALETARLCKVLNAHLPPRPPAPTNSMRGGLCIFETYYYLIFWCSTTRADLGVLIFSGTDGIKWMSAFMHAWMNDWTEWNEWNEWND